MSFNKMWDAERSQDILLPFPYDMDQPLYFFPWAKKIPKAVFRGNSLCHMHNMQ